MPNEIQVECYFKSADIEKLCKNGKDIVINFKALYPPDAPPTFEISANSFTEGTKAGKAIKSKPAAKSALAVKTALPADAGTATEGCPKPCR